MIMMILLMLCMLIFIPLLFLFIKIYTSFLYKIMITDQTDVINQIIDTESVPKKWRLKFLEKMILTYDNKKLVLYLKKYYIRKLMKLIKRFSNNTMYSNIEKNNTLLSLDSIKNQWERCEHIENIL